MVFKGRILINASPGRAAFCPTTRPFRRIKHGHLRVDWLCWYLTTVLVDKVLHFQHVKQAGFKRNAAMEALVTTSVRGALEISNACVNLPESDEAPAFVRSSADASVEYSVCGAGTAEASCTCVYFQRGNLCKHIIKVCISPRHKE